MNSLVLTSLLPVILLISAGFAAARLGWVRESAVKDLTTLVFFLLMPALLFRTMGRVHVEQLDFKPVAAYFLAVGVLVVGTFLLQGFNRRAAVLALAVTYSNAIMIGIALVTLVFGQAGLVTLLTLIPRLTLSRRTRRGCGIGARATNGCCDAWLPRSASYAAHGAWLNRGASGLCKI